MIYLDNAATTQMAPEVREAMEPFLTEEFGNPNSLHSMGQRAAEAVANARRQVAELFRCEPRNIIFTSGGSESNALAILGLKDHLLETGRTHLITSEIEHESVLKAMKAMTKYGFDVVCLPFQKDFRRFDEAFSNLLTEKTGFVSFMNENNEVGEQFYPAFHLLSAKGRKFLTHIDMVQTTRYSDFYVKAKKIDFLSLSGHKLHGPKGVGVLYAKNPELLNPLVFGGDNQEFGKRGGTTNVAGVVGMGAAAKLATISMEEEYDLVEHYGILRKAFYSRLAQKLNNKGVKLNGDCDKILNFQVEGVRGDSLVLAMSARGVCISAGSACSAHYDNPSHVLLALGLTEAQAKNSVRVSFSRYNTVAEVREAAKIMAECIGLLRNGV